MKSLALDEKTNVDQHVSCRNIFVYNRQKHIRVAL